MRANSRLKYATSDSPGSRSNRTGRSNSGRASMGPVNNPPTISIMGIGSMSAHSGGKRREVIDPAHTGGLTSRRSPGVGHGASNSFASGLVMSTLSSVHSPRNLLFVRTLSLVASFTPLNSL